MVLKYVSFVLLDYRYVSGRNFKGCNTTKNGCQHDSTGVATLLRNGFASLDALPHPDPASLTTGLRVWAVEAI
jgi:hypothetical protein